MKATKKKATKKKATKKATKKKSAPLSFVGTVSAILAILRNAWNESDSEIKTARKEKPESKKAARLTLAERLDAFKAQTLKFHRPESFAVLYANAKTGEIEGNNLDVHAGPEVMEMKSSERRDWLRRELSKRAPFESTHCAILKAPKKAYTNEGMKPFNAPSVQGKSAPSKAR